MTRTTKTAAKVKASTTLGDAAKAERERRGMTQREAADDLGVSQPVFSAWENDQNEPKDGNVAALREWLKVTPARIGELIYWGKIARAEADLDAAARRDRR